MSSTIRYHISKIQSVLRTDAVLSVAAVLKEIALSSSNKNNFMSFRRHLFRRVFLH